MIERKHHIDDARGCRRKVRLKIRPATTNGESQYIPTNRAANCLPRSATTNSRPRIHKPARQRARPAIAFARYHRARSPKVSRVRYPYTGFCGTQRRASGMPSTMINVPRMRLMLIYIEGGAVGISTTREARGLSCRSSWTARETRRRFYCYRRLDRSRRLHGVDLNDLAWIIQKLPEHLNDVVALGR
jgi:hypothetical protein